MPAQPSPTRFILPVYRRPNDERSWVGSSFLIPNYLITAGHVLNYRQDCFVRVGDRYLRLEHSRWLAGQVPLDDMLGFDAAIYPLEGMKSPLSLATAEAVQHQELTITGWQRLNGEVQQVTTSCLVLGDDENEEAYFKIATVDRITHGASGCPIYRDGKVYGLLAMGRDEYNLPQGLDYMTPSELDMRRSMETNTCWVFRASHIARLMP